MVVASKGETTVVPRDDSTLAQDLGAPAKLPDTHYYSEDEVLDLRYLLRSLLRKCWIIVLLMAIGAVIGVNRVSNFSRQYEAYMIVIPSGPPGGGGGGAPQPGLGAKVALALGVSMDSKSMKMMGRLRLALSSFGLAKRLEEKTNFNRVVFASSWDNENQRWRAPPKDDQSLGARARRYLKIDQTWTPPNAERLANYLGGVVKFEPIEDTPRYRSIEGTDAWQISVRHQDGQMALKVLTVAVEAADELLREQDFQRVLANKRYLEERLRNVRLTELRIGLGATLLRTEQSIMMLTGNNTYAVRVVEPARLSGQRTQPNLVLTIGMPTFGAAVLGFCLIMVFAVLWRE